MKIAIIDSSSCPFNLRDFPELLRPSQQADIIIERFSPFVPFIIKDRYGDTEITEYRAKWMPDKKHEALPATRDRAEQERNERRQL